jgi:hypothetical protein
MNVEIYIHALVTLIHKMFIFWDTCLLMLKGDPAYKRRLTDSMTSLLQFVFAPFS